MTLDPDEEEEGDKKGNNKVDPGGDEKGDDLGNVDGKRDGTFDGVADTDILNADDTNLKLPKAMCLETMMEIYLVNQMAETLVMTKRTTIHLEMTNEIYFQATKVIDLVF